MSPLASTNIWIRSDTAQVGTEKPPGKSIVGKISFLGEQHFALLNAVHALAHPGKKFVQSKPTPLVWVGWQGKRAAWGNAQAQATANSSVDGVRRQEAAVRLLAAIRELVDFPAAHGSPFSPPHVQGPNEAVYGNLRRFTGRADSVSRRPVVLIRGRRGTGKEQAASYLHAVSPRPGALVALNCAALPSNLFEEELFGHIKGAFTDATECRDGAFVKAIHGTLFLDEIGDLPPDQQAKLLRALQERIIQRVGDVTEFSVLDVQIVAATNRDLEDMISQGKFRDDLYDRLFEFSERLAPYCEWNRPNRLELIDQLWQETPLRDAELLNTAREGLALHDFTDSGNIRGLQRALTRLACTVEETQHIEGQHVADVLREMDKYRRSTAPQPSTAQTPESEVRPVAPSADSVQPAAAASTAAKPGLATQSSASERAGADAGGSGAMRALRVPNDSENGEWWGQADGEKQGPERHHEVAEALVCVAFAVLQEKPQSVYSILNSYSIDKSHKLGRKVVSEHGDIEILPITYTQYHSSLRALPKMREWNPGDVARELFLTLAGDASEPEIGTPWTFSMLERVPTIRDLRIFNAVKKVRNAVPAVPGDPAHEPPTPPVQLAENTLMNAEDEPMALPLMRRAQIAGMKEHRAAIEKLLNHETGWKECRSRGQGPFHLGVTVGDAELPDGVEARVPVSHIDDVPGAIEQWWRDKIASEARLLWILDDEVARFEMGGAWCRSVGALGENAPFVIASHLTCSAGESKDVLVARWLEMVSGIVNARAGLPRTVVLVDSMLHGETLGPRLARVLGLCLPSALVISVSAVFDEAEIKLIEVDRAPHTAPDRRILEDFSKITRAFEAEKSDGVSAGPTAPEASAARSALRNREALEALERLAALIHEGGSEHDRKAALEQLERKVRS